jgi:hypothetical protein
MIFVEFQIDDRGLKRAQEMLSPVLWNRIITKAAYDTTRDMAELYLSRVRTRILQGRALGPPLSAGWAARKGHDIPWLWTGWLLARMNVRRVSGMMVSAGFSSGPAAEAALRCELGTVKQPGRPVFEPEAKQLRREHGTLRRVARKNTLSAARRHGIRV